MSKSRQISRPLLTFVANAASLLTSDALNKITNFAIYAMVARYLGTRQFGQLSLALLLLYTCQVFTTAGLKTLITRQVAKRRSKTARYLVNGSVTVLLTSVLTTAGMILFAWGMRYSDETTLIVAILAMGLVPLGLTSVTDAIFRGWEKMHLIAWANVPVNLVKVAGAFLLLNAGFSVPAVAVLLVACRYLALVIEWTLLAANATTLWARVDRRFIKRLAGQGSTFLGMEGIIAVWASTNAVVLSKFGTESEVGLFIAASQLMQPVHLVYQSIVGSIFPAMCKKADLARGELKHLVRWIVELLALVGLPAAVALFFLADTCILMLYGDASFLAATGVVRVMVFVLLLRTLTNAFGHALWAGSRERITLRIVAINLAVNVVVGLILIHRFGLMGAAWTTLIAATINTLQHYLACQDLVSGPPIGRRVWKLLGSATLMVLCIIALPVPTLEISVFVGGFVYVLTAGAMLVVTHGGIGRLRTEYFAPLLRS